MTSQILLQTLGLIPLPSPGPSAPRRSVRGLAERPLAPRLVKGALAALTDHGAQSLAALAHRLAVAPAELLPVLDKLEDRRFVGVRLSAPGIPPIYFLRPDRRGKQ